MNKETIKEAKRIMDDLETAEKLSKAKPYNIVIVERTASDQNAFKFYTNTAYGLIANLQNSLLGCLKEELMRFHERDGGYWTDIEGSILCECSVCGFKQGAATFNYCPVCGSHMEDWRDKGNG